MIEYFIGYRASSNASFRSREPEDDEWNLWEENSDLTRAEVEAALQEPDDGQPSNLPRGLAEAIESCGFEWWVQTREVDTGAPNA